MIWYKAIFLSKELRHGLDKQLEKDFNYLYDMMNRPEDMALFKSWSVGDQHQLYYFQMPKTFAYNLGEVFNRYRTVLTFEPQIEDLRLVIGITEGKEINQLEY